MLSSLTRKIFGSANDRLIKTMHKTVDQINKLEPDFVKQTDEQLRDNTQIFKQRIQKGESLDSILPEAFANAREAAKRVLGLRPFDVQLIGGIVLHKGMLSEMKTGEGKTLVATLPMYLNALSGKGAHLITVNDYLAKRDLEWMGGIYRFLGLTAASIYHELDDDQRRAAYACDITYGTNHEFGFDYLRDNMKFRKSDMVMRDFNYAIVDEVDSILIDEARTPLIISGPAEDSSELYQKIDSAIPILIDTDFEKDEKQHSVMLTESGIEKVENYLRDQGLVKGDSLYDVQNIALVHHVQAALKAHKLYTRDVEYIVRDGEVIIIDEFTGRMMEGRRYSDGLHQAIEAKEGVEVARENQTLATITYQNFFRLYPKLSGMAGTAMTEAPEFEEIYNLNVVEIPTNRKVTRVDYDDEIYLTAPEKYKAVIKLVRECQQKGQPVLIGTTSIEKSELVSTLLTVDGVKHSVLNARHHEKEAKIVAFAGTSGAVTVATNMAGRGTDIKLGGNWEMRVKLELDDMPEGDERDRAIAKIKQQVAEDEAKVKAAGGLYIVGTERHESRRIDNQLRGRSGRQGDPGASKFFISLDDDLMRIFAASENLRNYLRKVGAQEDEAISHRYISKSLEKAQQRVEARNFDVRKHLLKYDDVMNDQRKIVYAQRRELMENDSIAEMVAQIRSDVVEELVQGHSPKDTIANNWDFDTLAQECAAIFNIKLSVADLQNDKNITAPRLVQIISEMVETQAKALEINFGVDALRHAEKSVLLRLLDQHWKEHLLALDHIRQSINLRAYAQSNPLNEYKREAFNQFQMMMSRLKFEYIGALMHFQTSAPVDNALEELLGKIDFSKMQTNYEQLDEVELDDQVQSQETLKQEPAKSSRVLRNADCPCGSGKKFKHCHGAV
jgi:preprotein translocase subunit SecA